MPSAVWPRSFTPTCALLATKSAFDWDAKKYLRDGFGTNPAFEGFVAEVDSRVVGYALYHSGYDTDKGARLIYLIDLFVSQEWRRRGIGEKLMQSISEVGRKRNAEWIVWNVFKRNPSATSFYEKLGARYEDELHIMCLPI